MLRNKILVIFLIFGLLTVSYADSLTIISPAEGEEIVAGEDIEVHVETDYQMASIYVQLYCTEQHYTWTSYAVQGFPEADVMEYSTGISTQGLTAGPCKLKITGKKEDYSQEYSTVEIVLTPGQQGDEVATVTRSMSDIVYPGGYTWVTIHFFPHGVFSGVIIREHVPESVVWENNFGISPLTHDYDAETRTLKVLHMSSYDIGIKHAHFSYLISIPQDATPGSVIDYSQGDWVVLENTGPIIGDTYTTVAGYTLPGCPITDEQLLQYVDQWADSELGSTEEENDEIIQQIVEVWMSC